MHIATSPFIPIILIIVTLAIYLVWKLMGTSNKKKPVQRRFSIRKHRQENSYDEKTNNLASKFYVASLNN